MSDICNTYNRAHRPPPCRDVRQSSTKFSWVSARCKRVLRPVAQCPSTVKCHYEIVFWSRGRGVRIWQQTGKLKWWRQKELSLLPTHDEGEWMILHVNGLTVFVWRCRIWLHCFSRRFQARPWRTLMTWCTHKTSEIVMLCEARLKNLQIFSAILLVNLFNIRWLPEYPLSNYINNTRIRNSKGKEIKAS